MAVRYSVDRRQFLAACLAGGGAALAGIATPASGWAVQYSPGRLDACRVIGDWYLDRFPSERSPDVLLSALHTAIPGFPEPGTAFELPSEQLRLQAAVEDAIDRDIASGDVMLVGNSLLTRTECRLCAQTALLRTS